MRRLQGKLLRRDHAIQQLGETVKDLKVERDRANEDAEALLTEVVALRNLQTAMRLEMENSRVTSERELADVREECQKLSRRMQEFVCLRDQEMVEKR